jgi:hypothetical protein
MVRHISVVKNIPKGKDSRANLHRNTQIFAGTLHFKIANLFFSASLVSDLLVLFSSQAVMHAFVLTNISYANLTKKTPFFS